ncbi:MAG TPA: hypothetical protein VM871_01475 [Flavisolibacter sp.]|nr:hypothetical protein [Flavisolibacter sp.]
MAPIPETDDQQPDEINAAPGNASNPSPAIDTLGPPADQLLSPKAEKYLREAGNIEDLPDPQEEDEAEGIQGNQNGM